MFSLKDRILKYSSLWLFLLLPFVYFTGNLYPHVSSKMFFIYGAVEILFFTWVYSVFIDHSYRINKKNLLFFIPAILFVLWMTISSIYALNPNLSFFSSFARGTGLLMLYHCLAFSFVATSLFQKYGLSYVYSILKYFIIGAVIGAISIWLAPSGFGLKVNLLIKGGEGGLIGNSSLASIYMFFAMAFSLFLISSKSVSHYLKKRLWLSVGIILFSPLFINITGFLRGYDLIGVARAGFVALFVSTFAFFIFYLFLSSKKSTKIIGGVLIFVSLLLFLLVWNNFLTPGTMLHEKFKESATGTRFIFWDTAQRAMNDSPVLGYGPENYPIVFQKYFNPDILQKENSVEGWADRAHNIYYDLGVSGGYPVIFLYVLFLATIFYGIYISFKNNKINRTQASILASLLVGYIFQNLFAFESNLSMLAMFLLCSIVFYLANHSNNYLDKDKNISGNHMFALFIFIIFLSCFIFFVYRPMYKSILYQKIFSASLRSSIPPYNKLLTGSSIGSDWDASDSAFKVYQYYASNIVTIKNSKELPQLVKNLDALISYLYKVEDKNKTDFRLYLSIVYLENTMTYLTSRPITPELKVKLHDLLEKAQDINPNGPNVYWTRAQLLVWEGDLDGAIMAYKDGIRVAPRLPASYKVLLDLAKIKGDQKLFNELIIEAQKNVPGFTYK